MRDLSHDPDLLAAARGIAAESEKVGREEQTAMLVWVDVDANFLCIEKHLARMGVTAE